jgi:predicted RNA binding protein YcfA (HicA-like mRNA interferase family)
MPKLPVVSGAEAVKAFQRVPFEFSHQSGSHIILRSKQPPHRHLSIPNHRELGRGLLRGLIRDAGLTVEEFIKLL